jgi:hypothetical protein
LELTLDRLTAVLGNEQKALAVAVRMPFNTFPERLQFTVDCAATELVNASVDLKGSV